MYMYAFDIFYKKICTISLPFLLISHRVILCSVNVILMIISHFDYITYSVGTNGVTLMRLECKNKNIKCIKFWIYKMRHFIFSNHKLKAQ